jgi:glutamate racemase
MNSETTYDKDRNSIPLDLSTMTLDNIAELLYLDEANIQAAVIACHNAAASKALETARKALDDARRVLYVEARATNGSK